MKPKLIVTSHGHLAEEILKSASMIAGDVSDILTVSMEAEDGLEGTTEKMKKAFAQCADAPLVVIADLFGGTPFNVASMLAGNRAFTRVVSGMNLGMIIEYSVTGIEDENELADYLVQIGRQGVFTQPVLPEENSETDEDEIDIE